MHYHPGMHLIATLHTQDPALLHQYCDLRRLFDEIIILHHLQKLGEVYHNFSPAGFTAVVCLSESHFSVHTWPEHGKLNLDIYLSNFQRNNDEAVKSMYAALQQHFKATIAHEHFIRR